MLSCVKASERLRRLLAWSRSFPPPVKIELFPHLKETTR